VRIIIFEGNIFRFIIFYGGMNDENLGKDKEDSRSAQKRN
jgi:hypothetical protein